jgi:hypothetical protein
LVGKDRGGELIKVVLLLLLGKMEFDDSLPHSLLEILHMRVGLPQRLVQLIGSFGWKELQGRARISRIGALDEESRHSHCYLGDDRIQVETEREILGW